MSALGSLFDFLNLLVRRILLAVFLLGGLLLGLLIAIKVVLVFTILWAWRRFRADSATTSVPGQVFDGEYTVVNPETPPNKRLTMDSVKPGVSTPKT